MNQNSGRFFYKSFKTKCLDLEEWVGTEKGGVEWVSLQAYYKSTRLISDFEED